ncbi:MAG: hypothetical protein ACREGR_04785, partial [Minisyncoccia bacterium]
MSIEALQDYVYVSKYSRHTKAKKRRETWDETVDRVRDMHLGRYPQIKDDIEWAFEKVREKRVLGSQRALQFGGEPILRKHARLYNCTVSYCDRMRFFQESLWLLLCGCGVGFSVQTHHINKLPDFDPNLVEYAAVPEATLDYVDLNSDPRLGGAWNGRRTFVVPDTIEGWADALGVLMATYLPSAGYEDWLGIYVDFDFSQVRPAGSYLSSGSGKAPGPEPLRRSLEVIRKLLNRCLKAGQTRLRSIDAYDIIMHASDAVLSGGVRRSATICIFSLEDEEMMKAKTGNWYFENPQ